MEDTVVGEPQIEIIEKENGDADVSVTTTTPGADDVDTLSLKGYFNITGRTTGRATTQLQTILEYMRGEVQSEDQAEVLMAIRHLENRMGAPRADESRVAMVYNYIRAQQAVARAEKQRDSFLR